MNGTGTSARQDLEAAVDEDKSEGYDGLKKKLTQSVCTQTKSMHKISGFVTVQSEKQFECALV